METTVFVLNSRCINIDGFCTFQHGLARKEVPPMFKNACMLPFEVQVCSRDQSVPFMRQACMIERQRIWERVHVDDHPCGACALYEFKKLGIGSLKVVGRGNPLERKLRDVEFLKTLLDRLDESPAQAEFRASARMLYTATYKRACRATYVLLPRSDGCAAGGPVKPDYYRVLGVDRTASAAAIKKAYRSLAMNYHPDRNQGDELAEEKFKLVNEAYATIGNAEKRVDYDAGF